MSKIDSSPQVAIVVVSYNTRDLLLECLDSAIQSSKGSLIEIVVVDNASSDGSPQAVAEAYPQAKVLINRRNSGFGAACNQAIEATRSPLIILLNSDAQLTPEGFSVLFDCMKSIPGCAAAGCRLVNIEGRDIISTRYFLNPINQVLELAGFPTYYNIKGLNRTYAPRKSGTNIDCRVDWIEGACLMLRRKALEDTGLFDEQFFMYSEEEDLCKRLRRKGWSVCYCAEGSAVHLGGASSASNREDMLRQFYASQMLFLMKHRNGFAVSLYAFAMKAILTFKRLYYEAAQSKRQSSEFSDRLSALKKAHSLFLRT